MSTGEFQNDKSTGFATTQWSLVLSAGGRTSPDAEQALAALCNDYWYPLYAYARRRYGEFEARDLTQGFFIRLLEKNLIESAEPTKGRFRSFLLTSFKNFLANEWQKNQAKKRGGGSKIVSFDFVAAESRYPLEAAKGSTPERLFERQWVLRLLDAVLDRMREGYVIAGKTDQFAVLKDFIVVTSATGSYADLACKLGVSENSAKVTAHRFRRKYAQLLRREIARTVANQNDVEDEISYLFSIFGD